MQIKRAKRSRARAANKTAGHGSKKKNRGSGHRGGKGASSSGKRGAAKIMKVTKGVLHTLGRHGFTSLNKKKNTITLQQLRETLTTLAAKGKITFEKGVYTIDLSKLGYDKLLSKGSVSSKMNITVEAATEGAVSKVEAAGGKVETLSLDEKSEENK